MCGVASGLCPGHFHLSIRQFLGVTPWGGCGPWNCFAGMLELQFVLCHDMMGGRLMRGLQNFHIPRGKSHILKQGYRRYTVENMATLFFECASYNKGHNAH